MEFDKYRIETPSHEVLLGLRRSIWFQVSGLVDQLTLNARATKVLPLGQCKRAVLRISPDNLEADFEGAARNDLADRVTFVLSNNQSIGLGIERVKGKPTLVAHLFSQDAIDKALAEFARLDALDQ